MTIQEWMHSLPKRHLWRVVWELSIKPRLALTMAVVIVWHMGQSLEQGHHVWAIVEMSVAASLIHKTIRQQIRMSHRLREFKARLAERGEPNDQAHHH